MNDRPFAGRVTSRPLLNPSAIFTVSNFLPAFLYLLLSFTGVSSNILAFIVIILSFTNFFILKNISGYQLLGLKWSYNFQSCGISVFSRPEPFVPNLSQSNFFWIGLFFINGFWIVCFFVNISTSMAKSAISAISFAFEFTNLIFFGKAHRESKQQIGLAVLASINDGIHFEQVPEQTAPLLTTASEKVAPASIELPPPLTATEKVVTPSIELPPPLTEPEFPDDEIF
jgi:hypothetical protein